MSQTTHAAPPSTVRKVATHRATTHIVAAAVAVAATLFGVDVSHYQSVSQTAGAAFTIAKASQGAGFRDPEYATFRDNARRLKVPFGAYHFLTHGNLAGQARNAVAAVGTTVPLAVDCEWVGKCDYADIAGFVAEYRKLGGRVTLLYVPRAYWVQIGSPNLARVTGVKLWNARYLFSGVYPGDKAAAWQPYGGLPVALLQYSDGGGRLDHDAFRGTRTELCALLTCWGPTPAPSPSTAVPATTSPKPTASPSTATPPPPTSKPRVTPAPTVTVTRPGPTRTITRTVRVVVTRTVQGSPREYVLVRSGDTLASIARATNVPLATIRRLNPTAVPALLMPGTLIRFK